TLYPVSIPAHGMALNLTVQSYCGALDYGLTACRKTVPDLRKLAGYLDESLFGGAARAAAAPARTATPGKRPAARTGTRRSTAGKGAVRKPAPRAAKTTGKTARP